MVKKSPSGNGVIIIIYYYSENVPFSFDKKIAF